MEPWWWIGMLIAIGGGFIALLVYLMTDPKGIKRQHWWRW